MFRIELDVILYIQGEHDQALSLLEREMQQHFGNVIQLKADNSEEGNIKRKVYAKVRTSCFTLFAYSLIADETARTTCIVIPVVG